MTEKTYENNLTWYSEYDQREPISPEEAERIVSAVLDGIEDISPVLYDRWTEPAIAQGVVEASRYPNGEVNTELLESFAVQSSRFDEAALRKRDLLFGEIIVIPEHEENLLENGSLRREESGPRVRIERLNEAGINPQLVLMFRVTQPSAEPKPELYWTSDPAETLHGLTVELGGRAASAVVLVDSLASVAENGGLIRDINDDGGVAVRQRGQDVYDQKKALAIMLA